MTYVEYRDRIQADLSQAPAGKTWRELKTTLALPCPEWTKRLEREIQLDSQ